MPRTPRGPWSAAGMGGSGRHRPVRCSGTTTANAIIAPPGIWTAKASAPCRALRSTPSRARSCPKKSSAWVWATAASAPKGRICIRSTAGIISCWPRAAPSMAIGRRSAAARRYSTAPMSVCPHNPIICRRGTQGRRTIQATGHADLVRGPARQLVDGLLGLPQFWSDALLHNLGRETFLTPVTWTQDGWPVVRNGGLMQLEAEGDLPHPETVEPVSDDLHCDFAGMDKLPPEFNYLRNPVAENYRLDGALSLTGTVLRLSTPNTTPTFTGIRQTQFISCTTAVLEAGIPEGCAAGITAYGIRYPPLRHPHHPPLRQAIRPAAEASLRYGDGGSRDPAARMRIGQPADHLQPHRIYLLGRLRPGA